MTDTHGKAAESPPVIPTAAAALAAPRKAKVNPFGAAKPREDNLKEKGVDAKALDEKIEARLEQVPSSMTAEEKEKYKALADALTELKNKVDAAAAGTDEEALKAAQAELAAKENEKREFVKSVRSTKITLRYKPPVPTSGVPQERHHHHHTNTNNNTSNSKIYVGDLDPSVTDEILADAFAMYGHVQDAEVCKNRDTGFSRGYGFVTMGNPDQAVVALRTLSDNGGVVPFQGSPVRVNYANTRRRDGPPGRRAGGYGYSRGRGRGHHSFGRPRDGPRNAGFHHQPQQPHQHGANRDDVFQNFGSNGQRYRNNYRDRQPHRHHGGYSSRGNNGGRGGYNNGRGGYNNGANRGYNRGYQAGGYNERNNGYRDNRPYNRGGGNWQQQKAGNYAPSNYMDDHGDHAMLDRMLEGDMY